MGLVTSNKSLWCCYTTSIWVIKVVGIHLNPTIFARWV